MLKGDDEIFSSTLTDVQGRATIMLEYESIGEVYLTVTKKNCIPIEESFQITQPNSNVNLSVSDMQILDQDGFDGVIAGNDDGDLNPGEIVYLSLPVFNYGTVESSDIVGILTTDSPLVNVVYGISSYDNLSSNSMGYNNSNYIIEIAEDAIDGSNLELKLSISGSNGSWESVVPIDLKGGLIGQMG